MQQAKIIKNKYCIDCTKKFISNIDINKKATIKNAKYVDINGKRYYVNDKNKIIHQKNEEGVAKWLKKRFGGKIEYLPNIGEKDGIQCADYLFKNEFWDLKELTGNGKRTLEDAIKNKKKQASNFIIDISNSKMTKNELLNQALKIYGGKSLRWVDKFILKKDDELIAFLQRKK